jgi:hypothetical protein
MSRSTRGTKKTSDFIDHSSAKKVERAETGRNKYGRQADGTDASHIMSFGLANVIMTNTRGRPMGGAAREAFIRDMNDNGNLRIKSSRGNKVLDERRDARIADAFVNSMPIMGTTTAQRAHLAYQTAKEYTTMDALANQLGNMRVYNEETGRTHMLKNHHKYI